MTKGILALEDGRIFYGLSFGKEGVAEGEVVFNTSMTGYQEILTDPSYHGQIVNMTYPLIGNYGVNRQDMESNRPWAEGFVVREASLLVSNWRSDGSLPEYLRKNKVPGIEGIDTRALTRHIRRVGSMKAVISTRGEKISALVRKARAWQGLVGVDTVSKVTCRRPYKWQEGLDDEFWPGMAGPYKPGRKTVAKRRKPLKVVVYDFGVKHNILRMLVSSGCQLEVVPATTSAQKK